MLHLNKTNLIYLPMLYGKRTLTLLHENIINKQSKKLQVALKKLEGTARRDDFNGLLLDFTALQIDKLPSQKLLNNALGIIIENEKKEKLTHVLGLKIPSNNSKIIEIALNHSFQFHNANPNNALLNLCLENHQVKECTFPPHRTVSAGVTAVVFDRTLKNVLVVMEKVGVIKKFKPPTGGIDYGEGGETPLDAVVRELKEEVQIEVDRNDAIFVGTGWTNFYRGTNPDISYIFAFIIDQKNELHVQEKEISQAQWIPFEEFAQESSEEKQKPWLLRQAVKIAFETIKNTHTSWKPQTLYLSTGKPVEFFSTHSNSHL